MANRKKKTSTEDSKKSGKVDFYPDKTPATADEAAENAIIEATALGAGVPTWIVEASLGAVDLDQVDDSSGSKKKKKP